MNLFCFSLEGSTDSLYELPQINQSSEPTTGTWSPESVVMDSTKLDSQSCFTRELQYSPTKHRKKLEKQKPHTSAPICSNEKTVSSFVYWPCSKKNNDSGHHQNGDADEDEEPYTVKPTTQDEPTEVIVEGSERDNFIQGMNFKSWNPNLPEPGGSNLYEMDRDEKLYGSLKRNKVKKNHQTRIEDSRRTSDTTHLTDIKFKDNDPVVTCIGLTKRSEKSFRREMLTQQTEPENMKNIVETETPSSPEPCHQHWRSKDVSLLWESSYHTCHRPTTDTWLLNVNFTLPRATDRHRYEELVHDLDLLRSDYPPLRVIRSFTDLDMRSASFGRFDRQSSKPEEHEDPPGADGEAADGDHHKGGIGKKMKAISLTMRKKMGRKYAKALSEEMGEDAEKKPEEETEPSEVSDKPCTKSSNSAESLYSLHSGQSSSSGVTSCSESSNNRDSLRLEEEVPYTGSFCGKAKVHTDFLPSPYDTESLKLKVGDLIDIISKPPMGIWTGMLKGKVGNFKFIYVDVLPEEPAPIHRMSNHRKSKRPRPRTLQEFLERLNLEEFASALLLNGYQTVDDLKDLKEQHLIELNVTDPEHRNRLLAASESLQDHEQNTQREAEAQSVQESPSETIKVDPNDCPRDSGCYVASDCSDNSKEDAESHLPVDLTPSAAEV